MRPCFDCTKALLQAKVSGIYYLHDWTHPIEALADQYELIQARFPDRVRQLTMDDPKDAWANDRAQQSQAVQNEVQELIVNGMTLQVQLKK